MSIPSNETYHAALASRTRRRVLHALAASPSPVEAQLLASQLGLHVTTVRFHLDQLEQAHLVRRQTDNARRRGRPSILYSPAGRVRGEDAREQLIDVLAGALSDRGEIGRTRSLQAGRRWASNLEFQGNDAPAAVTEVLERLGFDPEPDGDTIRLHGCPFRSAARAHPEIVCSVHRGLLQQVLQDSDQARELSVGLIPFVEPELCLVTLTAARG